MGKLNISRVGTVVVAALQGAKEINIARIIVSLSFSRSLLKRRRWKIGKFMENYFSSSSPAFLSHPSERTRKFLFSSRIFCVCTMGQN
jgi:hypothetical protein